MSKQITIDISNSKSVGDAIRLLMQTKPSHLKKNAKTFVEKMVEEGVDTAKALVAQRCVIDSSGELEESIHGETIDVDNNIVGLITTSNEHAKFVEYGTGVVGMASPHPTSAGDGWAYDVHGHGEEGWFYPKNGTYRHTLGQTAKRFMYDTAKILEDKAVEIAKEVIGSDK